MQGRALIVDGDSKRAALLEAELTEAGIFCTVYDGVTPADGTDLLILAPMPGFTQRDPGELPYAICDREAFLELGLIEPRVCVLRPFPWQFFIELSVEPPTHQLSNSQLLALCRLSLLANGGSAASFDQFAHGTSEAFMVAGCAVATGRNAGTISTMHTLSTADRTRLLRANRLAARAQITTVATLEDEQRVVSILSCSLSAHGWDGYLAPFSFGWRPFSENEIVALSYLSERIEREVEMLKLDGSAGGATMSKAFYQTLPGGLELKKAPTLVVPPAAPKVIGDENKCFGGIYRVGPKISLGGMGTVYRGEDLSLHRPVAIKVLHPELARTRALVSKLQEEARLLASVHHPNMVQVYALGLEDDTAYFVMEYVDGVPITDLIDRANQGGEKLDISVVTAIVEEIADALDTIHELGIIHRDVKPDNILLDGVNCRAVLVDVGIARRVADAADIAGTPGFTAPECFALGEGTSTTDVYGLAATCYAMLTGALAFEGTDWREVVRLQEQAEPRPVSMFRNDLSPAVDAVLTRALHPNPQERYTSGLAFAIALSKALKRTLQPQA